MSTTRSTTVAAIVRSVLNSDAGQRLTTRQADDAVHTTLRTVIALNCLDGNSVDIDLGNGHFLACNLKQGIGPTDV
ncbi:MAG: hypothetical protein PHU77_00620 [Simplicispira sp.]|nr:hypothetical protein [Simplicispira sp.]